eukprot:434081_1
MRILITVPSSKYEFEFKLLKSLIHDIMYKNSKFRSIEIAINTKIINHSQPTSHTHHIHYVKNLNPYFSINLSETISTTSCNNHEIHIPVTIYNTYAFSQFSFFKYFIYKVKFETNSIRSCIRGYFRGFTEKMKLQQQTDGIVLQQHKFTPFTTIQVSLMSENKTQKLQFKHNIYRYQATVIFKQ